MFHITIRDLLWLTLLAAVAVAWWVDRERLAERLRPWDKAVEEFMKNSAARSHSPAP